MQWHGLLMVVCSSYLSIFILWTHIRLLTHFGVRQTICGMSVVGVDWENLKRYNLAEIYQQGSKRLADPSAKTEAQATPRRVSKDEAERVADKGTTKPEGGIKSGAKIGDQR
jgi:hypothetical protein